MRHAQVFVAATVVLAAGLTSVPAQAHEAGGRAAAARPLAAPGSVHPDFNRDGYADLIVTAQGDDVAVADQAGGFWVLYGGRNGANTGNQHAYFTASSIGRGATSVAGDIFGYSFTTGDFNGDGYDDAAVSAPEKNVSGKNGAGAVVVLYGSVFGLITSNAQFFTEATSGMGVTPETSDRFGWRLAAGDFNRDGRDDLAVGAYGKAIGGATQAGIVYELFGTAGGLSHASPLLPRRFHALMPEIRGGAKTGDKFGYSLAAADFNGDRYVDLAVGAPGKTVGGQSGAGAMHLLRGSSSGLTTTGAQTWTQDTSGVPDSSEANDRWAYVLGALDINGDGRSELVIGAPTEGQGATPSVGATTVLYGSAYGPTSAGALFWLVSNTTLGQTPEQYDYFGSTFAPFDFDGDGRQDLAIGVQGRDVSGVESAGEVVVLHNVGGRLSRTGGFVLSRATPGMIGPPVEDSYFGALVRGGDWSGNGRDDLAVSLPYIDVSGVDQAGAMQVFYSAGSALGSNDAQFTVNNLGGTPHQDAYLGGYDW